MIFIKLDLTRKTSQTITKSINLAGVATTETMVNYSSEEREVTNEFF